MNWKNGLLLAGLGVVGTLPAAAGDEVAHRYGKAEYEQNCLVCHGRGGTGGGPVAEYFKEQPPNLNQIAKRNNGRFSTSDIYQIIDGRRGLRGHGDSQMPVWGNAYKTKIENALATKNVPHDLNTEFLVHARIVSLVYYLESIQED